MVHHSELIITPITQPLTDVSGRRLQRAFEAHVAGGRLAHALDLRPLSEVDSTTLAGLIRALRAVRYVGGFIAVIAEHPNIRKVFSITGLDRIFPVYSNEAEAQAAMAPTYRISA